MDVIDLASWMNAIGYSQEVDDFFDDDLDEESPSPPHKPAKTTLMSIRNRFGSQGLANTPMVGDLFYAASNLSMYELGLKMELAIDYYGTVEQDLFNDACLDLETIADPARLGPDANPETVELVTKHRANCQSLVNDLGGDKFGHAFWTGYILPILAIQNLEMPDARITGLCDQMHVRMGLVLDGKKTFKASQLPLKQALRGLDLVRQGV